MGSLVKLQTKTLRAFSVYALLVLAVSIPVYYWRVDSIWIEELDEHNRLVADKTIQEFSKLGLRGEELDKSISLWNSIQPSTNLVPVGKKEICPDSVYSVHRQKPYVNYADMDRLRGLKKTVRINDKYYDLTIETNLEESSETVFAITILTLLFGIILILGFLYLSKKMSDTLWQPFRIILEKLQTFKLSSQQPIEFLNTEIFEFVELQQAVDKLVQHSIATYSSQKEFTENASHELQTPLAILQNKIDILMQSEGLSEQQYEIIEQLNTTLLRLSRINKNLLLLARMDNQQYVLKNDIDVTSVLDHCIEELQLYADNESVLLKRESSESVSVVGNQTLIEILVYNLVLNAIRYSSNGSTVLVRLTSSTLSVYNPGITPLVPEAIFRRFSKSAMQKSGSGLGLAIVQQICALHGWKAGYEFVEFKHRFSIRFIE